MKLIHVAAGALLLATSATFVTAQTSPSPSNPNSPPNPQVTTPPPGTGSGSKALTPGTNADTPKDLPKPFRENPDPSATRDTKKNPASPN